MVFFISIGTENLAPAIATIATTTTTVAGATWTSWMNTRDPYLSENTLGDYERRLAMDPVKPSNYKNNWFYLGICYIPL